MEKINNMSTEEIGNITMKKFVKVKIRNTSVKMQLDTSSDITIINEKSCKYIRLNDCLVTYNYSLPSLEEVFAKLNGRKFSSKLDLFEAYLQIQIEEDYSHLLTVITHCGLFKFKWLPLSVKVDPAIFQQVMDAVLRDCDFAIGYLDDILIKSESQEQHFEHIKRVFGKISEYGFKLIEEKCELLNKIKYLGQIIDKKGRKPDLLRQQ
eukprot:XP_014786947.1 PREDICTED: uncharacterized protein K02A2.6-like [Octopus bimaculoides]